MLRFIADETTTMPLMSLGFARDTPYAERARILLQHRIALWDVIQGCKRCGSLDSAIDNQSIVANDFVSFYRTHPHIRRVFFNGMKTEQEYRKRVLPGMVEGTARQFDKPRMNFGATRQKLWSSDRAVTRRPIEHYLIA